MSTLRDEMEEMIAVRQSLGFDGNSTRNMLNPFIKFCENKYPDAECITKEMTDSWLLFQNYTINTQIAFIASLRNLCKHMRFTGSGHFVPNEEYNMKKTVFEARPLNKHELNIFFKTVDNHIPATIAIKYHGEYILPVLFRMMFCLGLRPGEPLRLRTEDVNLETGEVYIRESKKHRDRHLFMSEDLLLLCRKYDDKMPKDREFFFETVGKQIQTPWMTRNFKKLAEKAGLPQEIRPYDLRHTFASLNLIKWLEEGKEAMDLMPYLSQFMGHSDLSATCYYIHLLPNEIKMCSKIDWGELNRVYKGFGYEETV